MKRLIIAIDCDDVLVDTAHDILAFYNNKYGTKLDESDFYSYSETTRDRFGVNTLEEAIERFNERLLDPEHHSITPSQEAIDAIHKLARKHELHLVTGRQDAMEAATIGMVETYFPGCFTSVEHTNYMTADHTAVKRTKGEVCQAIKADVMIDDYLGHIRDVLEAGIPQGIVFGDFDWGKRQRLPVGAVRCIDWQAVLEFLDG